MKLSFETNPELTDGFEIPVLLDIEKTVKRGSWDDIEVDGVKIDAETEVFARFLDTITTFETESLPPGCFRDCVHFMIHTVGIEIPAEQTNPIKDRFDHALSSEPVSDNYYGPVALGIPNDERCLGFGDIPIVAMHCAQAIPTSAGTRYLQKLGVDPLYALADLDQSLGFYDLEVAHAIEEFSYEAVDRVYSWSQHPVTN